MLGPIFNRESLTVPRRSRHYVMRTVSLGALWVLAFTVWQTTVGWEYAATINDLSRFGLLLFQILTYVQLVLLLFFAGLAGASTISQEKDRRTFVLLLMTDLRNYEIVLGKVLGSLLQMLLFLAGTLPILCMILLLGGVAGYQVLDALLLLATTCLAAGSLGGLIALWREKTFQALALTVLVLLLFLCVVHALSLLPWFFADIDASAILQVQQCLSPFAALPMIIDPPENRFGLSPALAYALSMVTVAVLLNAWSIWKLRVWNPSGEPVMQREKVEEAAEEERDRTKAHAAPGAVRPVWANPILWREIATRAYGRRPYLVKIAYFLVLALICYYALSPKSQRSYAAAFGLVPVTVLSLLLVSAQAVTSITSERDTGSLDLLLVTDLTAKEFIFGKLFGILYNTKEYLIPPLILAGVYGWFGWLARPDRIHEMYRTSMNVQFFICIVLATVIVLAFAMVLGIHVALRNDKSRVAIGNTLGTIFFLSIGTLVCIYLIVINGRFEAQWLSFSLFIFAGVGGLWWVLSGDRPSTALTLASWACPFAVFYTVTNLLIGKPGLDESSDPFVPFIVTGTSFVFAITAMMVPLLSEFDVAMGRTSGTGD